MELDGFDWDDGNTEHCRRHGVALAEIESLFLGTPLVGPDPYPPSRERRHRAVGKTPEGRFLFVVFTWRLAGTEQLVRPVSARYMHQKEIEAYAEKIPHMED